MTRKEQLKGWLGDKVFLEIVENATFSLDVVLDWSKSPKTFLRAAFLFEDAPEGIQYWREIESKLSNKEWESSHT